MVYLGELPRKHQLWFIFIDLSFWFSPASFHGISSPKCVKSLVTRGTCSFFLGNVGTERNPLNSGISKMVLAMSLGPLKDG